MVGRRGMGCLVMYRGGLCRRVMYSRGMRSLVMHRFGMRSLTMNRFGLPSRVMYRFGMGGALVMDRFRLPGRMMDRSGLSSRVVYRFRLAGRMMDRSGLSSGMVYRFGCCSGMHGFGVSTGIGLNHSVRMAVIYGKVLVPVTASFLLTRALRLCGLKMTILRCRLLTGRWSGIDSTGAVKANAIDRSVVDHSSVGIRVVHDG
jgi:hypothetical protein